MRGDYDEVYDNEPQRYAEDDGTALYAMVDLKPK